LRVLGTNWHILHNVELGMSDGAFYSKLYTAHGDDLYDYL